MENDNSYKTRKVIRTMKQMVYVVLSGDGTVDGVFNDYSVAERYADSAATITPVLVDRYDETRWTCDTPSEVVEAMEYELKHMGENTHASEPYDEDKDEDEDEDDSDEDEDDSDEWGENEDDDEDWDDEDEDEDEDDPIDSLVYELDEAQVISKEDATLLMNICVKNAILKNPLLPWDMQLKLAGDEFEQILEGWGVEGVDMRDDE